MESKFERMVKVLHKSKTTAKLKLKNADSWEDKRWLLARIDAYDSLIAISDAISNEET